jgi:hypothetical protein
MSDLTRQEMFNRAYLGLKSQEFKRCLDVMTGSCVYAGQIHLNDGTIFKGHCAWGWVDPSVSAHHTGSVEMLRRRQVGLAANLVGTGQDSDIQFAMQLQQAHDSAITAQDMKALLTNFAQYYDLTIPDPGSSRQTQVSVGDKAYQDGGFPVGVTPQE